MVVTQMAARQTGNVADGQAASDPFWELSIDLLCVADFEGRFTRLNPQWERLLGWSRPELMAKPWMDRVHPEDQERTRAETERIIDGAEALFENRYRCKDGSYRWLSWSARSSRRTGEIYATARDVTLAKEPGETRVGADAQERQIRFMKEVNAFNERLLKMTRAELQPPIAPIKVQLEVLRENIQAKPDERFERALRVMQRNLERLEGVVSEIMDAERVQHGTLRLAEDKIDLDLLVNEVVTSFHSAAEIAKVHVSVDAATEAWIEGDARRLRLALAHILSNAIKFTEANGEIQVRVERINSIVEIAVRDTGIGMTTAQVAQLFQPFAPVHDPARVKTMGHGLGLYLAKGIIERHGGRIEASSQGPGQGSSFLIRLPRHLPLPDGRAAGRDGHAVPR